MAWLGNHPHLADLISGSCRDELTSIADELEKHPLGARAAADTRRIIELARTLDEVWDEQDSAEDHDPQDLTDILARYNERAES
jgi:hypothetical protein